MRARVRPALALALLLLGLAPAHAEGRVEVRFVDPDRYTDAWNRFGSGLTLKVTLGEIRRIIEESALRGLRPGEALVVEVLDIDLAGFEEPGANFPYGLRVVRDFTAPTFRLRYVLTDRGRRVLGGEERVTDVNVLLKGSRFGGSFVYERDLLRDWVRRRLVERRRPGG